MIVRREMMEENMGGDVRDVDLLIKCIISIVIDVLLSASCDVRTLCQLYG